MINNDMLEGNQGFATLEDVDQGTLTRFIEWLYRGYYHPAAPKQIPKPEQPSENPDGQKTREVSSTSSASGSSTPRPTFGGIDATEALRGVFSAPATGEPPRGLFGGATLTAPPTAPPAGDLFGGATPTASTTTQPSRGLFGGGTIADPPTAPPSRDLFGGATPTAPPVGALFGGATPTAPSTAQPSRGLFGAGASTAPPTAEPRGFMTFGSAGATQASRSSLDASTTSENTDRAARRRLENSVPLWQGPNPFRALSEASTLIEDPATLADPKKRRPKVRKSSSSSVAKTHSEHAKEIFLQRKYNVRQTVKSLPLPREQDPFRQEQEDFSEVFLCHAYLHVFADKYDIQTLKVLALEELHATLADFILRQECTGDILNLLRYVYKEAPEQPNKTEDLRTLMTQYMESEFGMLVKDKTFGIFLSENNGDFQEDFLNIVRKRQV